MENWGLILYRESAVLFDNEKSLLEDEFFVTLVVSHEIAHSVRIINFILFNNIVGDKDWHRF